MYRVGEREMVFCPYNRYHIVSKLRIQKHLIKCQKNYPDVKLATCFYNYSHRLKPEDMLKHYEICSHKTRLEGSRYCEPNNLQDSYSLENSDPFTEKFPNIHGKPKFFTNPVSLSSTSKPNSKVGEEFNYSSSGSESENDWRMGKDAIKAESSGDDSEDDLEPLPLPKTVSKAFVCVHQGADKFTPEASQYKRFGRGKNCLVLSPSKPSRTSDHFLPDLRTVESDRQKKSEGSKVSEDRTAFIMPSVLEFDYVLKSNHKSSLKSRNASIISSKLDGNTVKSGSQIFSNSGISISSSMFDDSTTFKSEEIIFDEDSNEEDKSVGSFIIKKFNSNVNI